MQPAQTCSACRGPRRRAMSKKESLVRSKSNNRDAVQREASGFGKLAEAFRRRAANSDPWGQAAPATPRIQSRFMAPMAPAPVDVLDVGCTVRHWVSTSFINLEIDLREQLCCVTEVQHLNWQASSLKCRQGMTGIISEVHSKHGTQLSIVTVACNLGGS